MKVSILIIVYSLIVISGGFSQNQILLTDKNIPSEDTVWVFLPNEYDEKRQYPAVYMLHGYSSNYSQWHQIMDAQKYADQYQMIIICPDGFYNSWYINSPKKKNSQFADFFFETLVPEIESTYSIDSANRFITGLSMGGHGSFYLFLKFPKMFKSAGSSSGVMDLRGSSGLFELDEHFGSLEGNEERWKSFSAVGNITKFKDAGNNLILDCGTEDPFYKWNKEFYEMCLESKLPITFISQPGKHDWDYWEKSIGAHFEFFKSKVAQ